MVEDQIADISITSGSRLGIVASTNAATKDKDNAMVEADIMVWFP
jgi:hypothetical protein